MGSQPAHQHVFLGGAHAENERRTWFVVALTGAMMVAEIAGGSVYGSMALVADGWHMATHAGALAISGFAYRYARRHAHDPRFSFGTGKLGELAGYSSALILAVVAMLIGYESLRRFVSPVVIRFDEAIVIAVVGLAVNLVCAWILRGRHGHSHPEKVGHAGRHHHHDHNLRSAYLHVLADAFTSVLAIGALGAGLTLGWARMDPLIGIVGAVVIARWAVQLLRSAGAVLLDRVPGSQLPEAIRERLETGLDRVTDLHVWRVGPGHFAVIAAIASDRPEPPDRYRERLEGLPGLSHVTIEVQPRAAA
jgi:cation diffusion facilitator family transporter